MELAVKPGVASNLRLLEAWIESKLAYDSQPAMNIGIVYDQELIWAKAFGYADREKSVAASLDDIYFIASQSKLFTAVALLKLRDEGRLQLDDPASKFLPEFSNINNRFSDAPAITIRHLLTHTSGLPSEAAFPYWTDFNFPEMEQILKKLPQQETSYPAETMWKYSNLAYALAGEIVAVVSGAPYVEYIRRHILDPLGMTDTGLLCPGEPKPLVKGYGRRMPDGNRKLRPFTYTRAMAPCGGFSSTVGDMARFAAWIFRLRERGGTEILKSSSLKEMQRVHWLMPDWQSGWGLGFGITHTKDRDIVFHGGWVAGSRTNLALSLKEKVAVITMQNTDDATTLVVDRVFEWVVPAINQAVVPEAKAPCADPLWEKYTGLYRSDFKDSQVLIYQDRLVWINPTAANPAETMYTLIPAGENTFRMEGGGWGAHGELITFELGPDGQVSRVKEGENYLIPVK